MSTFVRSCGVQRVYPWEEMIFTASRARLERRKAMGAGCRLLKRAGISARGWSFCLFLCCLPGFAQSQSTKPIATQLPDAPAVANSLGTDVPGRGGQQSLGSITSTVVDQNGNFILSARVKLVGEGHAEQQEVVSDSNGHFTLTGVPAGPFELTITADGFATVTRSGMLQSGEAFEMPAIALPVAATTTEVQVNVSKDELAEEQIKIEEKQRVLGFIPNFYVSYDRNAPSLNARQKFELAWKTSVDPVTILASGAFAGMEQATNGLSGYGQGAQGYAKRFGASYADGFIGNMIGSAILPSLLKQDPRYFYKGTGSTQSRILNALAFVFVCKGDNGRWQPNYSSIGGSLAAGGISNLYYPASDRDGVGLTFQETAIGFGFSGISNLFQEFLIRKLTPHAQVPR